MFFPRSFKPIAAVGSKEEMSHESVTLSDVHTFHAPLNKRPRWSMNAELYWTEGVWSSWSHALNGYFHPLKTSLELHFMTLAAFVGYTWTTSCDHPPSSADRTCNLGRNKIEQQPPPPPQSRMKQRNSQNAQISHHWLGGEGGGYKFFIYFVQDCGPPSHAWTKHCFVSRCHVVLPPPTTWGYCI